MAAYLDVAGYRQRAQDSMLPTLEQPNVQTGVVEAVIDTQRIEDALNDASGRIRAIIPAYTVDAAGDEIPFIEISEKVRDALPGLTFDIARYELGDVTTGSEDVLLQRYEAAIEVLKIIAGIIAPRTTGGGGSGTTPGATTPHLPAREIDGRNAGQWIPGTRDRYRKGLF